jgi:predicted small secreted protein
VLARVLFALQNPFYEFMLQRNDVVPRNAHSLSEIRRYAPAPRRADDAVPSEGEKSGFRRRIAAASLASYTAKRASIRASQVSTQREFAMRKLIVFAAAAAALMVSACNTVSGIGRDAQAAGRAVTGAAEDAKR